MSNLTNTNTLPASTAAGNPVDAVQLELDDMAAALTDVLERTPTTADLMVENVRRNKGPQFSGFRKEVDNTLLRRQIAEQDALLASTTDSEKAQFFARLYPLTTSEQRRAEEGKRLRTVDRAYIAQRTAELEQVVQQAQATLNLIAGIRSGEHTEEQAQNMRDSEVLALTSISQARAELDRMKQVAA